MCNNRFNKIALYSVVAVTLAVLHSGAAIARDQIQIVGSSTVYPFATIVAERFGNRGKFKTPVIESTGTGGGMKLFCQGVGSGHPDVSNASRAMKTSVCRQLERIGDHASNIAEDVIYLLSGDIIRHGENEAMKCR